MLNLKSNTLVYGALLCAFVLFVADFAEARGRGGGGGGRGGGGRSFSRSGPASHGGFSSSARTQPSRQVNRPSQGQVARPSQGQVPSGDRSAQRQEQANTRQSNREDGGKSQEDRQEWRDQSREDRQEAAKDRQEDRQDFVDDQHDDYWDDYNRYYGYRGGVYVGTTVSTVYITTLPCTTTAVVVNGVTYYNCSSTWYQRGYSGSSVTYVTVKAPPGH